MGNFKNNFNKNFTQIPNEVLNDEELSLKSKGLLAYLISKDDNWNFSAERISTQNNDGKASVNAGLKELENLGYLIRRKLKNEKGSFVGIEYEIKNRFEDYNTEKPVYRFSDDGFSVDGLSVDGKSANISNTIFSNTINSNTIFNNIKNIKKEIFDFWNSKKLIVHREIPKDKVFQDALKISSLEEIKQSINNYEKIIRTSDFYFNHIWTLETFLKKQRNKDNFNFKRFLPYGDIFVGFDNSKGLKSNKNKIIDISNNNYDDIMG